MSFYGPNERPSWAATIFYALQHVMVSMPGLVAKPTMMVRVLCAGPVGAELTTHIISANFFVAGIATFLQSTFGIRLPMMTGPSTAFLAPVIAYGTSLNCTSDEETQFPTRFTEISMSLLIGCSLFFAIGLSGIAGQLSRRIGPVTIVPLILLLAIYIVEKTIYLLQQHWISYISMFLTGIIVIFLDKVIIPLPGGRSFSPFSQFPLVISIFISSGVYFILSLFDLAPPFRIGLNNDGETLSVEDFSWIGIPNPSKFMSGFGVDMGLIVAFSLAAIVDIAEDMGAYALLAKAAKQPPPPAHSINRAVIMEGVGSALGALLGITCALTTYTSNVAVVNVTGVASRLPMQLASLILLSIGLFPKIAALLAHIPPPIIGGVIIILMGMMLGLSLGSLKEIDLKLPRNLSIIGISIVSGYLIPLIVKGQKIFTGFAWLDQIIAVNLKNPVLIGGFIAALLDNCAPGATLQQRGLKQSEEDEGGAGEQKSDVYDLNRSFIRLVSNIPVLRRLPIFPHTTTDRHREAER